jgi:hypothetical protein
MSGAGGVPLHPRHGIPSRRCGVLVLLETSFCYDSVSVFISHRLIHMGAISKSPDFRGPVPWLSYYQCGRE